jgi:ADP-heptose:LPS heptosyltransferase
VDALINPFLVDAFGIAARAAGVPVRVGNLRRLRTLRWANRFIYMGSRQNPLHVANMNLRHLRPLGIRVQFDGEAMIGRIRLRPTVALDAALAAQLDRDRFNLVLHPKSNRNGREWPAAHFNRLVDLLPPARFRILVTGVAAERERLLEECPALVSRSEVVDLMGKIDLAQMLALLAAADGMVGNSTGPLHIAAALGIRTLGIFPGRHLASAEKWGPFGPRAETLSYRTRCEPGPGRCPLDYAGEDCSCMRLMEPHRVAQRVLEWLEEARAGAAAAPERLPVAP